MRLIWTVLAAGLSLPATGVASESDSGNTIPAKQALVVAALAVREARYDWETAEELVRQAESSIEAVQLEAEKAEQRGAPASSTARAFSIAQRNWKRALTILDARATRLGEAEHRLEEAETVLDQADSHLGPARR
jgi:hypothetical protein